MKNGLVHPEDVYDDINFDSKNYKDFDDNMYFFGWYENYNGLVLTNEIMTSDGDYLEYYFGFIDTL